MLEYLYFSKLKDGAIIPSKDEENGGYDIYANFTDNYIVIPALSSISIPTGIATAFSDRYVMLLRERGSTGTKNMEIRAGVIDSGYRDEIFICLYNGNSKPVVISKVKNPIAIPKTDYIFYPYEKAICQALMVEVPKLMVKELNYDVLCQIQSKRGIGKLGSSGK